jgi:membrane protein YdbS with pleckstrin-like domain
MGMDYMKTHYLGPRAFFLFLGRRLKWPILTFLLIAAAWYWRALVPDEYQIWSDFAIKLLFLSWCGLFTFIFLSSFFEYRSHSYRFDDEYFHVMCGYFIKDEIGVVYHQIQHVTIKSGIMARLIGVRNLIIVLNASAGDAARNTLTLPALDRDKATAVQRELLRMAHRSGRRAPQEEYYMTHTEENQEEEGGEEEEEEE